MAVYSAGEKFTFRESAPAHGSPEEWRTIDRAVWRWVLAHGGDVATAHAAAWVSYAEGQGHSALSLLLQDEAENPLVTDAQREALTRSPMVINTMANIAASDDTGVRPFVLDADHLYFLRNYRAEMDVARALVARRQRMQPVQCPLSDDDLRALFNGSWLEVEERQRAAVRQVLGRRLMVLTGGPGTGKTTTVLRMLLGLSREHHAATGLLPQLRIAAPTGKAAQRLAESLKQGAQSLQTAASPISRDWQLHMQAVLTAEATTVHRLLGSKGATGGYAFHAGEPLPYDIVVVDEASMLDLGLLRALLAALRPDAVLVLVGDADQLTSVGTGSVMMDVVQGLEAGADPGLVRLSHCFRSNTQLVAINEAVRTGDAAAFESALNAAKLADKAQRHDVSDAQALNRRVRKWADALKTTLIEAEVTQPVDMEDAPALLKRLLVLRRQQLLCALREGVFGAQQLSSQIAAHLQRWDALVAWSQQAWYPGRCVIVTRNDHAMRLYNGDVGVCVLVRKGEDAPFLQVAFASEVEAETGLEKSKQRGVRLLAPGTLPAHEDAFALTVHKSQGSEYEHVAVVLPPNTQSPLLVRQMLYTGLSRAKSSLELWATASVVKAALTRRLSRHGRLSERIQRASCLGVSV